MSTEGRQINKSAIRNFAIEARNILIKSAVTEAGFYGITKDEIKDPIQKGRDFEVYETLTGAENRIFDSDVKRRAALVEAIRQKGFDEVMEETAYTWFNRLIAIRFMEVNNYLPFRMRVLSSDSGSLTPDIVSRSLEVNLNLTDRELEAIQKAKDENSYDEAFRLLFIKTCNELNDILPGLFEKTDDYMELLLKLPYTSDGVVRMLVDTIPESNFNVNEGGQVEIIGWLYQYYNTDPFNVLYDGSKATDKIEKYEIPSATQLFTPDWIVRYMVENSLGKLWIEHLLACGDSRSEQKIADDFGWKFYLPEVEPESEVQSQLEQLRTDRKNLTPEDILCIDPCQGSGHILVYLFDVFMQIYREDGYSERDAARCILEHNLYGLDIDDRAYQLSYFAVLMKARQYDRMILKKHIQPHVYSIQESNSVNRNQLKYFGADMSVIEKNNATNQLIGLLDTFKDAKEYGSILNVDRCDWNLLRQFANNDRVEGQMDFEAYGIDQTQKQLVTLIQIGEAMAQKYHVVITNPPYMNANRMSKGITQYVGKHLPESKQDLAMAVFQAVSNNMLNINGLIAFITPTSWMFSSKFNKIRKKIVDSMSFVSLVDCGTELFEGKIGHLYIAAWILRKAIPNQKGRYVNLTEFCYSRRDEKPFEFFNKNNHGVFDQKRFCILPDSPVAYSVSDATFSFFENGENLDYRGKARQGLTTSDNKTFLRNWYEVSIDNICFTCTSCEETLSNAAKWYPFLKGGDFQKWYPRKEFIVNYEQDGKAIKESVLKKYPYLKTPGFVVKNTEWYFKPGITWNDVGGDHFCARYMPEGYIFADASPSYFPNEGHIWEYLAYFNSCVFQHFADVICQGLHYSTGQIPKIPSLSPYQLISLEIADKAKENYELLNSADQAEETSWDFKRNPLIADVQLVSDAYKAWEKECDYRYHRIKNNEIDINKKLIDAFGLSHLSPDVNDKNVSAKRASLKEQIIMLISYAVGCMFGRYSLDVEGLAYAGGDWKETYATKYRTFIPDADAIIPITDEEYFKDDIVARFIDFIRVVYGEETLEENLRFIADALGNKGDTPRAVIRNYFLNDFYKDHCNTYSVTGSGKRPIYWLFDSGKQNGFKALIYIHRYTPDTVGLIRSVYLHNAQAAIQNSLQNSEYIISTTTSATERARETRKKDKYVKQLNELRPYYQALSHIALQRIPMDLDDGVKNNYQLFQGVEVSTEGKKKQTIDLLAKI